MSRHLDGTGSAHPIVRFLDVLERELDDLVDAPTWSLDAADATQVVGRPVALEARLDELEARAVRHAETLEVPAAGGFRSTSAWLARLTHVTRPEVARKVRLAKALATHEQTREAMARGEVHAEQALVIDQAVDDLTEDHAPHRGLAEKHSIAQAADFDAHAGRAGLDAARPLRTQARPRHRGRRLLTTVRSHHGQARAGVLQPRRALPQRPAPQLGRSRDPGGSSDVDYRETCLISGAMRKADLAWRSVLAEQAIADIRADVERIHPQARGATLQHFRDVG